MSVSKILLAVAAVGAGVASAQSSCRASTITVASPAEATIACKTVSGDIVFDKDVAGSVIISGPEKIEGDVIIRNATGLASLSSSTIQKIGGKFELQGLRSLNAITFDALEEVGEISWITLNALETVTFGTDGVTTVKSVRISDTFLSSLEGLNMASVGTFQIDNNPHLTVWETRLSNITEELIVADNSADLTVSFPRLTGGGSLDVRGVKSLSVPLLSELSGSMLLTENNAMESFIAPNLTRTGESVSIRNNDALSNVSFPLLERTVGSLTVQNNQELVKIDGFPKLSTVEGAVTMLGNFTDIELPQLKDVRGAFNVQSTEDIEKSCEKFEEFAPSSDGGNGRFQGSFECVGENENANEGNGKGKKGKDDEDAGALFGVSAPVVMAVAAIGGLIQLL